VPTCPIVVRASVLTAAWRWPSSIRDNLDQLTVAIGACDAATPQSGPAAPRQRRYFLRPSLPLLKISDERVRRFGWYVLRSLHEQFFAVRKQCVTHGLRLDPCAIKLGRFPFRESPAPILRPHPPKRCRRGRGRHFHNPIMAFSGRRVSARRIVSVVLCYSRVIFVSASGEGGSGNGRLPDRGKVGRVVHSSCDHRRRIVGHRLLNGRLRDKGVSFWPYAVGNQSSESGKLILSDVGKAAICDKHEAGCFLFSVSQ
jgi:hypothetical protein